MTDQAFALLVTSGIYILALLYDRVRHAEARPAVDNTHQANRVGIFRYERRHLQ